MKTTLPLSFFALTFSTVATSLLADTHTGVQAESIITGEPVIIRASSSNASIDFVSIFANGPSVVNGPTLIGNLFLSGNTAHGELVWTPPDVGGYSISTVAYHVEPAPNTPPTAIGTAQTTFEVFTSRRIIRNVTITNGVSRLFAENGEILTAESSPNANVIADNGGTLIFWSGGRTVLKSGFHAKVGSFFWAAVDHDMNGYSDVEEASDTDGDGMFDAWEVEHGLNPIVADGTLDPDSDGLTNLEEFQQHRNPQKKDNPAIGLRIFSPVSS